MTIHLADPVAEGIPENVTLELSVPVSVDRALRAAGQAAGLTATNQAERILASWAGDARRAARALARLDGPDEDVPTWLRRQIDES